MTVAVPEKLQGLKLSTRISGAAGFPCGEIGGVFGLIVCGLDRIWSVTVELLPGAVYGLRDAERARFLRSLSMMSVPKVPGSISSRRERASSGAAMGAQSV